MTMMPRRAGALLVLLLIAGCGPSRPRLYPVTGTVTYKDQPVAGAQVTFVSAEGRPAQGTTDAAGKFSLTTFESGDGAATGSCKVTVAKLAPTDPNDPYSAVANAMPERYAKVETTPITHDVTAGPNDVPLKLTDE
jgi:hypothetical protein